MRARIDGFSILSWLEIWLASPEQAIKRVAQRVSQGGHHVAEEVISRRYYAGLKNLFECYLPLSDIAIIINNSIDESKNLCNNMIARKGWSDVIDILNQGAWENMKRAAYGK